MKDSSFSKEITAERPGVYPEAFCRLFYNASFLPDICLIIYVRNNQSYADADPDSPPYSLTAVPGT